jgi:hypothetical protein
MVAFAFADIDGDGVADTALIDLNGKLYVYRNERLGSFKERSVPPELLERNLAVERWDVKWRRQDRFRTVTQRLQYRQIVRQERKRLGLRTNRCRKNACQRRESAVGGFG